MAARPRVWLPVTCVLGPRRCRWGCTRPFRTHTGGSGSTAQWGGWSFHIPPEGEQNKTPTGLETFPKKKKIMITKTKWKEKGYITHNAPLMVNNPSAWLRTILSIISAIGWLVFGSSVPWRCVSAWPGLQIRPHCQRENVSKHHITVWQKPRKAVHLSCEVCLLWGLRAKPI